MTSSDWLASCIEAAKRNPTIVPDFYIADTVDNRQPAVLAGHAPVDIQTAAVSNRDRSEQAKLERAFA